MERICNFANFARISYDDFDDIEHLDFIDNKEGGMQYYLYRKDEILWVVFRGTDSLADALTDICFFKKSIQRDGIKIHSGFLNSYMKERDFIFNHIDDDVKKINITGHSYGGALALICSLDVKTSFPDKVVETIVFGCPRVGNYAFRKVYNKYQRNTICVENRNDVVTKLPPVFLGFRKVGRVFHIGYFHFPFAFSVKDHNMDEYLLHLDC